MFFSQEIAGFTKGFLISTWFGLLIGWIYPPPQNRMPVSYQDDEIIFVRPGSGIPTN